MNYSEIMKKLESMKNLKNIGSMARYGIIYKKAYGISIYALRGLAKSIGRDHNLALRLWDSGIREAKLLAVFLDDPKKVTSQQMDKWAVGFECWDDTDQATTSLFDLTTHAWSKVFEWAGSGKEFVKRGAFSLIAGLSAHNKKAPDKDFEAFFPLIKKHSTDNRNYVKKAVNWALRGIGKRNKNLNKKAVRLAKSIAKINDKTAGWIASNALKELMSEKVQERLEE